MKNKFTINNRISSKSVGRRGNKLLLCGVLACVLPIVVLCLTPERTNKVDFANTMGVAAAHHLTTAQDYGVFSHSERAHAEINCNACHQRNDNSITPRFAGHAACVNCHLAQFVTPQSPMCAICHAGVENSSAPLRAFPTNFNERFNMKFDHAAHNRGEGRPAEGCVACHKPLRAGVALSIPINLNAHNQCYSCHTPNRVAAGRDIGSCNTCHALGNYSRTSAQGAAFQASFAHSDHGARQRLSCNDCHSVKAGVAQRKQVSSPIVAEHFASSRAMSCLACHNDKRAFGERDFDNCKRCHTKASFSMGR